MEQSTGSLGFEGRFGLAPDDLGSDRVFTLSDVANDPKGDSCDHSNSSSVVIESAVVPLEFKDKRPVGDLVDVLAVPGVTLESLSLSRLLEVLILSGNVLDALSLPDFVEVLTVSGDMLEALSLVGLLEVLTLSDGRVEALSLLLDTLSLETSGSSSDH